MVQDDKYVKILKDISTDNRLSFATRGVYACLVNEGGLNLQQDFRSLAERYPDEDDAKVILSAIKELREYGYLVARLKLVE